MEKLKHSSISLHAHGDGTYHTYSPARSGDGGYYGPEGSKDPGRVEHESFGAAMMHMAKLHGPEGDHAHIHAHDEGYTTHHLVEGGRVKGPHDHKNLRELKRALVEFLDEEGAEE